MEYGEEGKFLYLFQISCTKLYFNYVEGILGYFPIQLYPNSIYMIVLNVLHSPRRKLSMKLQPHLPVQCDCSPPPLSSSLPSLPHSAPLSLPLLFISLFLPLPLPLPPYPSASSPPHFPT